MTRATTRASTQRAKEQDKKKKKATELAGPVQKKPRRKYVAAKPESNDEEMIESKDISQFRVVIHAPKSNIDKICDNVRKRK